MTDVIELSLEHSTHEEPEHLAQERAAAARQQAGAATEPVSLLDRLDAATFTTTGLQALPPARPLVEGLLDLDSLALLYGPSGGSKSFTAIDLALHVATGSWWNRQAVAPGPVIYLAAEGARGLGRRVAAWQTHHQILDVDRHNPVSWVSMPINLHNPAQAGLFADWCAERSPVLVIVDTLARCAAGADENSAKDMGQVIDNLDLVKRRTHACVLAVHHSGKDTSSGARGSSALRAAVDTELEVTTTDDNVTLKVTKQKDHAPAQPWRLHRLPVVDSCVLVPDRGQSTSDLTGAQEKALEALIAVALDTGVPSSVWQEAATNPESRTAIGRSTYFEARAELLKAGRVQNLGTTARPLYAPVNPGQEPDPT